MWRNKLKIDYPCNLKLLNRINMVVCFSDFTTCCKCLIHPCTYCFFLSNGEGPIIKDGQQFDHLWCIEIMKGCSRYLAQNAAIWLADEVLRYRDHDTSRCQDDISWHLITQQLKRRNANNGSRIVARNGESTHIYYERHQC